MIAERQTYQQATYCVLSIGFSGAIATTSLTRVPRRREIAPSWVPSSESFGSLGPKFPFVNVVLRLP